MSSNKSKAENPKGSKRLQQRQAALNESKNPQQRQQQQGIEKTAKQTIQPQQCQNNSSNSKKTAKPKRGNQKPQALPTTPRGIRKPQHSHKALEESSNPTQSQKNIEGTKEFKKLYQSQNKTSNTQAPAKPNKRPGFNSQTLVYQITVPEPPAALVEQENCGTSDTRGM
jgi:hypothetical protein